MTSFPVYKQSLITRKQCEIEQKLQLTTNSKSWSAFQNPHLNLRSDATERRNRRDVISGLLTVANNSETARDRAKVTNQSYN